MNKIFLLLTLLFVSNIQSQDFKERDLIGEWEFKVNIKDAIKNSKDLNGIEKLSNLKELCCDYNQLTSLKGIENLSNLEKFNINLSGTSREKTQIKKIDKIKTDNTTKPVRKISKKILKKLMI